MDEDYFLAVKVQPPIAECKKHGENIPYKIGHRYFCFDCVADHLEKAIGQVRVK